MIAVENLTKTFGAQSLFDQASFKINRRERVGLVGRNGHGKTTLFRILIGEEEYDDGTLTTPKGYRVGHVRQQLAFTQATVLEEGVLGLPADQKDQHWKVEKILDGLGFTEADMQQDPVTFSGGFQVRLNLAKALVAEPDLLLLDEPTNYLDITSIRWIERFLNNWPGELMLITHDRSFMDRIVTHTLGIHRQKLRKISGNTEKYYAQIAQDEEIYEKTRLNNERRAKEIEQFITRFRAKARLAGMVQSRIKTLEKLETKQKLTQLRDLDFSFRSLPFRGKQVLGVKELTFAHPQQASLIDDLSFTLHAGERLCVVGPNGQGKTTLLQLLAGNLAQIKGEVAFHPKVVHGVYEQTNVKTLNDHNTVEEEILYSHPEVSRQQARSICGAMLFEGDEALKKVEVLSGGEKARVMLGKLLATPANLLLLDEPSNHLDMESCDALVAAIDNFDGAVIMVTHNEMFLHALAQRLIVFHENRIALFEGTYQEFLEKGGWGDEVNLAVPEKEDSPPPPAGQPRLTKKELRRVRSAIINEDAKERKGLDVGIRETESIIESEEERLAQLNDEMVTAAHEQDGERIAKLSQGIHKCQATIDERFIALEEMYSQKEGLDAKLAKKLDRLEE